MILPSLATLSVEGLQALSVAHIYEIAIPVDYWSGIVRLGSCFPLKFAIRKPRGRNCPEHLPPRWPF